MSKFTSKNGEAFKLKELACAIGAKHLIINQNSYNIEYYSGEKQNDCPHSTLNEIILKNEQLSCLDISVQNLIGVVYNDGDLYDN